MKHLLEALINLLFPPKCPFCGKVLETPGICPACEKALPWTAETEGLRQGPGGLRCAAPLWYEGLTREGLLRFKFQGASAAAESLGELVARCAAERFSGEFDAVTWVPVSKKRLRKRGYDQAKLLAGELSERTGIPCCRLLKKTRNNPAQSGTGGAEKRRANVSGVYTALKPEKIKGKSILLVDDIVTTGATLSECGRILLSAGAGEVRAVTVARKRN